MTLEREDQQEDLAQALQAEGTLDQEKQRRQEQEERKRDREEAGRRGHERRQQGRGELDPHQKCVVTPASPSGRKSHAAETNRSRPRRRQVRSSSPSPISVSLLLQDPTPLAQISTTICIESIGYDDSICESQSSLRGATMPPAAMSPAWTGAYGLKALRKIRASD